MSSERSWERFVGSQTPEEFMEISTGHTANWREEEIKQAVKDYIGEIKKEWGIEEAEIEIIQQNIEKEIMSYVNTEVFKIKINDILMARLPLNSVLDESVEDEDCRVLKVGVEPYESWDVQCLSATLTDPKPKWDSIIEFPRFASGSKQDIARRRLMYKIKKIPKK